MREVLGRQVGPSDSTPPRPHSFWETKLRAIDWTVSWIGGGSVAVIARVLKEQVVDPVEEKRPIRVLRRILNSNTGDFEREYGGTRSAQKLTLWCPILGRG